MQQRPLATARASREKPAVRLSFELLSGRALDVLDAARALGDGQLVFPARTGRRLDVKLRRLLERCGIDCVPHACRSSFRDWAEETDHPREVIEAALAHMVQNPVEAAYARSDRSSVDGGSWRRCCTNRHWPARCQSTGSSSPADAIRHWPAEGGHPIEDLTAEDDLTPLPGWTPGAKAISDDGLVSEERVLHPALTMVS